MKNARKNKAAFTLIELLVVIAIIGLLSTISIVALSQARSKARDAKRIADVEQLMKALDLYYDANGQYPTSSNCGATYPNTSWCNSIQSLSGDHWIRNNGTTDVLSPFMSSEPIDPRQETSPKWVPVKGGTIFYYSLGQWYMIVFGLENYPNELEDQDGGVTSCTGTHYHYGSGTNGVITTGVSCIK